MAASGHDQDKPRVKPSTYGRGRFYRIVVRPASRFVEFRYHNRDPKDHIRRLDGKYPNGKRTTQAWLVPKEDAHQEGDTLVPDSKEARRLFAQLLSQPRYVKGDVFRAKDRPDPLESSSSAPV